MINEDIISEVGRPILRPLGFAQAIFLLSFIISPFLAIWYSWDIAWKTGLTGFIGTIVIYGMYNIAKKAVEEAVEETMERLKEEKPKSKFQERLAKLAEERGTK